MACVKCAQTVAHLVEVRGQKGEDSGHNTGSQKSLRVSADRRGVSAAADRGISLRTRQWHGAPPSGGLCAEDPLHAV